MNKTNYNIDGKCTARWFDKCRHFEAGMVGAGHVCKHFGGAGEWKCNSDEALEDVSDREHTDMEKRFAEAIIKSFEVDFDGNKCRCIHCKNWVYSDDCSEGSMSARKRIKHKKDCIVMEAYNVLLKLEMEKRT